jgi:hypothetical protein
LQENLGFNASHLKKLIPGLETFNQQHYWECHEVLEHVWLEDRQDPSRLVYWAIIQVAAALVHVREKNLIGARGMLNKAREKFQRAREAHIENAFLYTFVEWQELRECVEKVSPDVQDLGVFEELWNFRFKKYLSFTETDSESKKGN